MKMAELSKPVDFGNNNLGFGYFEELAYVVATSISPQIQNWITQKDQVCREQGDLNGVFQDLKKTQASLSRETEIVKQKINDLTSKLPSLKFKLQAVENKKWKWFTWLFMLLFGRKWREEFNEANENINNVEGQIYTNKNNLDDLSRKTKVNSDDLKKCQETLEKLKEKLNRISVIPKFIKGIRRLDYPIIPLKIQDATMDHKKNKTFPSVTIFLDPVDSPQKIVLPQIDIDDEEINELQLLIEKLKNDDVMLDPEDLTDEFGNWNILYGSENDIVKIIELLKKFTEKFRPKEFAIPIIQRNKPLGNYLSKELNNLLSLNESEVSVDIATKLKVEEYYPVAKEIEKILKLNRGKSERIDNEIENISSNFENNFWEKDYGRKKSLDLSIKYIDQSNLHSKLTRYHYYCPKCNATPSYLKHRCGLDEQDIEQLETAKIIQGLETYQRKCFSDNYGQRFSSEDRALIIESWKEAFFILESLQAEYLEEEVIKAAASQTDRGIVSRSFHQRKIDFIRKRYKKIVKELIKNPYKKWKEKDNRDSDIEDLISSRPIELLNDNTRLMYNPDGYAKDEFWNCPLCGMNFSWEEARFGAINKIRYDLIYPMIHNLWNHESVWSKKVDLLKDISREIRDRAVEESGALQAPIDQFLADSRQIRLQLQQSYAKGEATAQRLSQIAEQFSAIGLLDEENLQKVSDSSKAAKDNIDKVDSEITEVNNKENKMQKIPRQVLEEREVPITPERKVIDQDAARGLLIHKKKLLLSGTTVKNDI